MYSLGVADRRIPHSQFSRQLNTLRVNDRKISRVSDNVDENRTLNRVDKDSISVTRHWSTTNVVSLSLRIFVIVATRRVKSFVKRVTDDRATLLTYGGTSFGSCPCFFLFLFSFSFLFLLYRETRWHVGRRRREEQGAVVWRVSVEEGTQKMYDSINERTTREDRANA